jgi:hypothetical protein
MPHQHAYEVTIEQDGEQRVELVDEYSHIRAMKTAQLMFPDHRVVKVRKDWEPLGKCARCSVIVFKGDSHRYRGTQLRCADC